MQNVFPWGLKEKKPQIHTHPKSHSGNKQSGKGARDGGMFAAITHCGTTTPRFVYFGDTTARHHTSRSFGHCLETLCQMKLPRQISFFRLFCPGERDIAGFFS